MIDAAHSYTVRQVRTFLDAFADTGGFMTILFLVFEVVVSRVQQSIYFTSLIRSFYTY
jgi:hypothetical protein